MTVSSNPAYLHALALSRRIPNAPHPARAQAVHVWAVALIRALREGRA